MSVLGQYLQASSDYWSDDYDTSQNCQEKEKITELFQKVSIWGKL